MATGSTRERAPCCEAMGDSPRAPSLQGSSSGAWRRRRRSSGRCHSPWRPGRLPAAVASKRIAPGTGQKEAAVVLE